MKELVQASTTVAVDPAAAFAIFTEEVDAWWERGPRFRPLGPRTSKLAFEGEALVERPDDGGEPFELGRVLVWDPPERLVFSMGGRDFRPDDPLTEVEVRFAAHPKGTEVAIVHRGFEALPLDHAARHGMSGEALVGMMGLFWADLLVALRTHVHDR